MTPLNTIKNCIKKVFPFIPEAYHSLKIWQTKIHYQTGQAKLSKSYENAIQWFKNNQIDGGGIAISSRQQIPYLEVSGYIVPTLYQWGERTLALQVIRWLITQQNADGSFSAPDGTPYTFDTGQVMRGLLSAIDDVLEAKEALVKACNWILTQIKEDGRLDTPSTAMWGDIADDRIHLYCLPPLMAAAKKCDRPDYAEAGCNVLEYYKKRDNLTDFNTLSHFCAYIWEALADLGEHDLAKKSLQHGIDLQNSDGSVPAYSDKKWICLTGVAQMALVGYKIGATDFSNKCMNYLGSIQNNTGGFLGSVGRGANYFPTEEPSWAVKYYLDAFSEKQRSIFNMSAETFPREIKEDDNRVTTVINGLGNINDKIVLDAGCGQGRYLKILANKFPNADLHGVDISDVMLKNNPASITTSIGSLLEINYPDNTFDCVYSVEALEHSLRPEAAIGELTRILKLNGKLIIIDKSTEKIGKIKLNTWEQWFDPKTLAEKMEEYGIKTTYKPIAYDKCETPDGWFYVWEGTKQ